MVVSMDRWRGKVAIVTGASSGIGAAIAEKLVEEGMEVVGLARRCERMQVLQRKVEGRKGKFHCIKCDLSQESDILKAFVHITENIGPIHVLVNNAGTAHASRLVDGETEKFKNMLMVNVLGLCIATREAIKDMKKNNVDGHIIHMNSVIGHYVTPALEGISVYPATKHAVTALTETLRQELTTMKSKIRITSISPGVVMTEIFELSGLDLQKLKDTVNKGEDLPYMKPEDIADTVVFVLSTPPHVNISELTIKPVNEPF